MTKSGYFDSPGNYGFTQRTYWTVENGAVSITAVQMQSKRYGNIWYPDGEIAVNDEIVFTMDNSNPATHSFYLQGVGDSFIDIAVHGKGQTLPAKSNVIKGGKAVISVSVSMYNEALTITPKVVGSVEIDVASVLPVVHDGTAFQQKQAIASDGAAFKKYRPIVHDGAAWST